MQTEAEALDAEIALDENQCDESEHESYGVGNADYSSDDSFS